MLLGSTDDMPATDAPGAGQRAFLCQIPNGVAGIVATLKVMVNIAKQYRMDPRVRAQAERLIANVPEKQSSKEIRAIYEWVRDNIRYTSDVRDVETVKTPDAILESGQGDCDDKSLLVASLLESVGFAARFVAVAAGGFDYDHVYAEVRLGEGWIPLETTEPVNMGWRPPSNVRPLIRHI